MTIQISNLIIDQLEKDYLFIKDFIIKKGYTIPILPKRINEINDEGESFAIAYPIQGLIKYHGLADFQNRIAYFPSISLNNSSAFTISYVKFDKNLKHDTAFINGNMAKKQDLDRIINVLNAIRRYSGISTKAILISRNFSEELNNNDEIRLTSEIGKGLGTSASGGAALAMASLSIIFNNNPDYIQNKNLISIFSRYLAGSASRSVVGGIGLWLSYSKIKPFESFSIRLDTKKQKSFVEKISLITISIQSNLKTDLAHKISTYSPFYTAWALNKKRSILEFINALHNKEFHIIGKLVELDSLLLHSITKSGSRVYGKQIDTWNPQTWKIIELVSQMEHVYFSIDTGPSVVLLTLKNKVNTVIDNLKSKIPNLKISIGKIAGPCEIIKPESDKSKLLKKDIERFLDK
ncbi:MAG: diphosphomevalonate/mevalonate 3,5-bisphosphate decarboxylase family protein [Candidatus Helarchaeota archaeon]